MRQVTIPAYGRDLDSRLSTTIDSAYSVSPTKTGWVSRISSQPRFIMAVWLTSMTDSPSTIATESPEFTMIFPTGARAAKCALKWFWLVFIVSSVNQVLSASLTVRPSGCW